MVSCSQRLLRLLVVPFPRLAPVMLRNAPPLTHEEIGRCVCHAEYQRRAEGIHWIPRAEDYGGKCDEALSCAGIHPESTSAAQRDVATCKAR